MPTLRIVHARRVDGLVRLVALAFALTAALVANGGAHAAQVVIDGPTGSGTFGANVIVLPNGNFVVVDPSFDEAGVVANVGAVHLYRPNGQRISTLRGTSTDDSVGGGIGGRVVVLTSGNFVVVSPNWDNGASDVGAVTFVDADTGINGIVSPSNSLVGSAAGDRVGDDDILVLANGNYVVKSTSWNGDAGAATWGSGTSGVVGPVSAANSLVGSSADDRVGGPLSIALPNGNYVIVSLLWNNGAVADTGAVTFGPGSSGISGAVSASNSLVGSRVNDLVGSGRVVALGNGNYVVTSPNWDSDTAANVGAATFGSGIEGVSGVVSAANSLVGSSANDAVGNPGVVALPGNDYLVRSGFWDRDGVADAGAVTFASGTTGIAGPVSAVNSLVGSTVSDGVGHGGIARLGLSRYVVCSPQWDNGATANVGAATFSGGTSGITGAISAANSLIGSTANDEVCGNGAAALTNGNYVVLSRNWDNGTIVNAGAATFASGTTGRTGPVSQANSLVGGTANDKVGSSILTLTNGNYVVLSPEWDRGTAVDSGAASFASGTTGISGLVSQTNSLVGSTGGDLVGTGATALTNGNYVVRSPTWRNGATATANAGAVTFGSGMTGITGFVTPSNSLHGVSPGDQVGRSFVLALPNGNYVVGSIDWRNNTALGAGAVTLGSGTTGITGPVTIANSLVGILLDDEVGDRLAAPMPDGNYVVKSSVWDNGGVVDAGAITLGLSNGSVVGAISNVHSVLGTAPGGGELQRFSYDPARKQLVVGQPASNRVVLHRPGIATSITLQSIAPGPSLPGQPVTVVVSVVASPNAPADGEVNVRADTGETCIDTSATAVSATANSYSCTLVFPSAGTRRISAEYRGSIVHAYSGTGQMLHATRSITVFGNGFEAL